MAALLAIHSCSLGAPILIEEAKKAGVVPAGRNEDTQTPTVERTRAAGIPIYTGSVFPPKLAELISIALDASFTHMYAPGTRRHIRAASQQHGASVEEIMEVLKLCVASGVQSLNVGVPILAKEVTTTATSKH